LKDTYQIKYDGRYAPLPYKFHGYPKVARNQLENAHTQCSSTAISPANISTNRLLRPRYLCFLESPGDGAVHGMKRLLVSDWERRNPGDLPRYLFIAYSTEQFRHSSREDLEELHKIAEMAARNANLPAYWIACTCMPDAAELEEDVRFLNSRVH
jgi:hypothetical protein